MELYKKTAFELSDMLVNRKCSKSEILHDIYKHINKTESEIGAYITLNSYNDRYLNNVSESVLSGIPIAIKDNISTKGLLTTCGSKMLENYIPPYNATVIDKLEQAGAIIIGKTNMDEFAMGSSTENSFFHLTHNPIAHYRTPGGSSGGSAAAVASGEAILALGSDTGGSVRQPAAFCGVVGFKPTYGTVSRYGLIAFASSLEQIGVIGRTVRDTAILYENICGADKMDATTIKSDRVFTNELTNDLSGLRIGIPCELFGDDVEDQVKNTVLSSLMKMESEGAELIELSLPSLEYAAKAYYIISSAEASSNLARFDGVRFGYRSEKYNSLTEMYENSRSEGFGDEVKRRILLGTFVLSTGYYEAFYKRAMLMRNRIQTELVEAFCNCDIIASPTYPIAPFRLGEKKDRIKLYAADKFTVPANLAGLPAISVPCGKTSDGLPIGLQLMGAPFYDQIVFNTANAFEIINNSLEVLE